MSSRCLSVFLALALIAGYGPAARALSVCADPNNLPFSNRAKEGLENHIVELIASELAEPVEYVWHPQRRGFIRNTLATGLCDVVASVPSNFEMLRTTVPYYRSTYVFVTRMDKKITIDSLDDPDLRRLIVGVQIIGDDGANSPPAHALSRRGIINNVRGFPVYGNYAAAAPLSPIIDAVATGDIDVAIAWGPLAGYFANRSAFPLLVVPVQPAIDGPMLPMIFDISMGVRHEDHMLRDRLDAALQRRRDEIDQVLDRFSVPRVDGARTSLANKP
jgi:mxaJ protein